MSDNDASVIFGFNDRTFSDRELIIGILPENVTGPESGDLHPPGNGVESDCSSSSEGCSEVLNFHVNSLLLARESPFFHKLFTNGMMESKQRRVTMRIHASEKSAFVELLKYMYGGKLTTSSAPALLDVLKLANKFEVISCVRRCAKLLAKLPMSTEFAMLYLDFTSSTSRTDEIQPLADATKRFLEDRYNDIDKFRDEIMEMPLAVMEIILSSDVLKAFSEDSIFDLVVKWIETHYPKLEDQKDILSAHLGKYIRFPYLSLDKLREVLSCNILDDGFAYKAAVDALFFKVKKTPHLHAAKDSAHSNYYHPYVRRDYKRVQIKLPPFQERIVHFDLKFLDCANLKPKERICSDTFDFDGREFYLYAECSVSFAGTVNFRIGMVKDETGNLPFSLAFEFSARTKASGALFVGESSGSMSYKLWSDISFYETSWSEFLAGKSLHSIDGYLFLELKLTRR